MTRDRLLALMKELARGAPKRRAFRVYLVGGSTAVHAGWRAASIDVDLFADDEAVFHDIQNIKERMNINIVFASPEHYVPAMPGTVDRHLHIETIGRVSFNHFDPYAQVLSKVIRGFERDIEDANQFIAHGLVDGTKLLDLVKRIPEGAFSRYPQLSRLGLVEGVQDFLANRD